MACIALAIEVRDTRDNAPQSHAGIMFLRDNQQH
jgi:hypothetical protein